MHWAPISQGETCSSVRTILFLVSYPTIGKYLGAILDRNCCIHPGELASFASIERFIPDCEAHPSRNIEREFPDHASSKATNISITGIEESFTSFATCGTCTLVIQLSEKMPRQISDEYPLRRYRELILSAAD